MISFLIPTHVFYGIQRPPLVGLFILITLTMHVARRQPTNETMKTDEKNFLYDLTAEE